MQASPNCSGCIKFEAGQATFLAMRMPINPVMVREISSAVAVFCRTT
jgi:hypothetical protein